MNDGPDQQSEWEPHSGSRQVGSTSAGHDVEPGHESDDQPHRWLLDDGLDHERNVEENIVFDEASPELIAERDGVDVTSYRLPPCPAPFRHPVKAALWCVRALFGVVSLVLLLAVIAAIPVVNFLALGYLLEVEARVARTGRLRDAFLLLDVAPRIGSIVLGIWLWLIPLRLIGTARGDAYFIEPGGAADQRLNILAPVAACLIGLHLCLALARGGSLSCFFRPIKNLRWLRKRWRAHDYLTHAAAGIQDFLQRLRVRHHFVLGLKGLAGGLVWLLIPSAMLSAARPGHPLLIAISVLGGILLLPLLAWLPLLQARFASTGHWREMFNVRGVRELSRRAPLACMIAVVFVYALAVPLYLPKIYLLPSDAIWTVTVIFIVTIYPARVLTGWAVSRAMRKETRAWFGWRWLRRLVVIPVLAIYVYLLFLTPTITEHGRRVLFEHHALLLPIP